MAFERLTREARAAVTAACRVAGGGGQGVVEAEHLLLALASLRELQDVGLDHAELVAALAREEERSLAAVGVAGADPALPAAPRRTRSPRLGTSTKLALQRALTIASHRGDRRIRAQHLLLGVLSAEHGRVPRAMEIAGLDIEALRARL